MNKLVIFSAMVLVVLLLSGCASAAINEPTSAPQAAAESAESSVESGKPNLVVYLSPS